MDALAPVLLEPSDVARALGISRARVQDLADRGRLPVAARTPRKVRLFRACDVERLRAERAAVEGKS